MGIIVWLIVALIGYIGVLLLTEGNKFIFVVLFCVMLWIGAMFMGTGLAGDGKYKQGQVDAINGKIMYELVTQDDNTTEWVKIEE